MKKIISLILCFSMILCLIPQVHAKEYNYVKVKIDAGNGVLQENAIIQDKDLYLPAAFYSEVTRFTYDEDDLMYLIDGQVHEKAFTSVKINTKNETLLISAVKVVDLPDIIDLDGELYLPLSIMLPVLNADVADILDGVVYIANNELSLGEVLYDFEISDYTFNYASEFADNVWLGKLSYELPNYLLDSITHWRWDRLDIVFKTGDYNDYKDIFTEYLMDDDIYLESVEAEEPSEWMEIIASTQKVNEDFKTAFEWGEEFAKYYESSEDYFDFLEATLPYPHDFADIVGVVNEGHFSVMDALDVIEFFFNYWYQVEDHREMLDAVYHVDNEIAWNDAERRAARQIYSIYGGDVADGLVRGVWDVLCKSAVELATTPIKMYELTGQVTGVVMSAVLPHDAMKNAADISRLSLYESAMQSAWSNYYEYKNTLNTDDDVNNLRHSILMTLISSRSCYNVMLNAAKGYQDSLLAADYGSLISYYESRINKINAMICLLYKVADNVEYDSYEHIEEFAKEIKQKLKKSKILDTKVSSDSSNDKTTPDNAHQNDQANSDSGYTYRYSFDAGMLVLRTKNYDDIICAETIPENERKDLGFWSTENTDSYIQCDNVVFRTEGFSKDIIRYNSRGISKRIFKSDGFVKLIACEDSSLYFYYLNSDEQIERYYRINNCSLDEYIIECIAEIPCASDIDNNYGNVIIKHGEWIYFLYTDDPQITWELGSPRLWLYRLSANTGVIERLDSVYEDCSLVCRKLTDVYEYNGYYILEGVLSEEEGHYRTRCFYLFDPAKNSCSLLCTTGCAGSEIKILDGKCYHLHQNPDGTVRWAKTDLQGEAACEIISVLLDGDGSHSGILSNLHVSGNTMLYSYYGSTSAYSSYLSYCVDLTGANSTFEIEATQFMPDMYINDGIIYMFVNGAVVYSHVEHPDKWYDSGIRYVKRSMMYGVYSDLSFFAERDGQVYFVTCDYCELLVNGSTAGLAAINLNDLYSSTAIQTDFVREIEVDSTIFRPHAVAIQSINLDGANALTYSVQDKWGNYFGSDFYSDENTLGIVFSPISDAVQTVQYDTNGRHKYMSGVIGATEWSAASGQLRFYADGEFVYETPVMTRESAPIEFTIDISNADTVTVEAISQDGHASEFAISCIFLVMDHVSFHDFLTPPYAGYWLSEAVIDENQSHTPVDEEVDMSSFSVGEALAEYTWNLEGFRLSDTWDFEFYDTGRFVATNAAGAEPFEGTFTYLNEVLTLFYVDGQFYSEFLYDSETQAFKSTTLQRLVEQDYVDEDGIYHEPVYEYRSLIPLAGKK